MNVLEIASNLDAIAEASRRARLCIDPAARGDTGRSCAPTWSELRGRR